MQALIITSHPGPSLAITALTTVLAAQAAPHGAGPVLTAPALLAGQLSIGWSNDACDAARDTAARRTDKPLARGDIGVRAVWTAAFAAAAAGLAMAFVIGPVTAALYALVVVPGWAYNLGLKSSLWSGVMYLLGFGPLPAYAASTLPGHPAPRVTVTLAAGLLGLGAHFANVLPDLAADKAAGVGGLPQRVAARWGPAAVRAVAVVLLLAASVLLLLGATRPWVAGPGLAAAVLLAVASARGNGRVPFLAAIGIAAVDIALFVAGGETLA
ncbi:MAG TPA: UbiA family prenyltransferase [Trebonia sp.]|nr:UbiA family prenyltransferase [Trebonia sp.]